MKNRTYILATLFVCSSFVLLGAGINNFAYAENKNNKNEQQTASNNISGKVTEVIDTSGYTYAEVDTGKEKVWAAGPVTSLKVGDKIAFPTKMPMHNFHSKSMNRDFSTIYFVDNFITNNKESTASKNKEIASPHGQTKQKPLAEPVKGINKIEGGNTIAEIYTNKDKLDGKTLHVRGKVTKVTTGILGKNWLHIMDSSTTNDLTVTTTGTAAIGDVVVIEGKAGLNKDYGYGYVYSVIVEDAKVTKE